MLIETTDADAEGETIYWPMIDRVVPFTDMTDGSDGLCLYRDGELAFELIDDDIAGGWKVCTEH